MSTTLTDKGPQRKLLGIRKRCSNGHTEREEIPQPTKYLKEADNGLRSASNRCNISNKIPKCIENQGCDWFENSFCSTEKKIKVCNVNVY